MHFLPLTHRKRTDHERELKLLNDEMEELAAMFERTIDDSEDRTEDGDEAVKKDNLFEVTDELDALKVRTVALKKSGDGLLKNHEEIMKGLLSMNSPHFLHFFVFYIFSISIFSEFVHNSKFQYILHSEIAIKIRIIYSVSKRDRQFETAGFRAKEGD